MTGSSDVSPAPKAPIVAVHDLSVALPAGADRALAVSDVSLEVRRGEILCLVGESGSGKSVLSSAIMGGLPGGLRLAGGSIHFEGEDLAHLPETRLRRIRGNRIAMIFQEPMAALNPAIPVGRQIEEVFELHSDLGAAERRARVRALLAETHLPDPDRIARCYPHQLSGGQCQRVIIAMALAMNPALLIADEPTTALDVTTQAQVLTLIRELRDVHGHSILFITHDFGVVADIADRVAVMQTGRLVEIGEAQQVLNAPRHPYTRMLIDAVPALVPASRSPTDQETMGTVEPVLSIDRLTKVYGSPPSGFRALDGVSFTVPRGGTLAIVGESGSGKSTLARSIVRLVAPSSGTVLLGATDFTRLGGGALTRMRRRIQMIFQDPYGSLNPRHSAGAVVARAAQLGGLSRAEAWARAAELFELVGLKREAMARRPHQFSGGQRQRIGIARALAMRPDIIIADESVSALDVSVQKQVLALLKDLQRRLGLTILFITHDLRVAAQIADTIMVMRRGVVVEAGPVEEVLARPRHDYTRQLIDAAPGRCWTPPRLDEPAEGPTAATAARAV